MPFDPDKYLASNNEVQPEGSSFDPDKYLAGGTQAEPSTKEQFGPIENTYAGIENAVGSGLSALQPVLKPISDLSSAVSKPIVEGFKKTPKGQLYERAKNYISEQIPGTLSDVIPGAYSETGEGFKLKKGGIADPSYKGAMETVENAIVDPMNLVVPEIGGLISKGAKVAGGVAKKAASSLSGLPKSVIETYMEHPAEINKMITSGIEGLPTQIHTEVKDTIQAAIKKTGSELADTIKQSGGKVDMTKVAQSFDDAIKEAEDMYYKNPTEINLDNYDTIKNIKDKYIGQGGTIDPDAAFRLQQDLKELTKFAPKERVTGNLQGLPTDTKTIAKAARDSYAELNRQFETLTAGKSQQLKDTYSKYMSMQKDVDALMGDSDKTFRTLKTANNPAKKMIKEKIKNIDKEFGTDLENKVNLMEAYSHLENPSLVPISSGGATSTSRTLTGAGVGGAIGGGLGSAFGAPGLGATVGSTAGTMAASPAAIKKYMDLLNRYKAIQSKLPAISGKYNLPAYRGAVEAGKERE